MFSGSRVHGDILAVDDDPGGAAGGPGTSSYLIAERARATRATSQGAVKVRMPTGSNTEPHLAGQRRPDLHGLQRVVERRVGDLGQHA